MKFRYLFILGGFVIAIGLQAQDSLSEKIYKQSEVDVKPVFGKGKITPSDFLSMYLKYPETDLLNEIEGTVDLSVTVLKDGEPTDIKIIQGVDSSLNAEALRIANLIPYYTPGQKDGQKVITQVIFPVDFNLQHEETDTISDNTAQLRPQQENDSTPLFIVDGNYITKNIDLDANKIESIRVLKGEKAIQLYGIDGKNGVVIITTKSFPGS